MVARWMARSLKLGAVLLSITITLSGCSFLEQDEVNRKLLWSQEFNESGTEALDQTYWSYEVGDGGAKSIPGWGNNERQYYLPEGFDLDGQGSLRITASRLAVFSKDNPQGMPSEDNPYFCWYLTACEFTSGRALTENKLAFQYGRMEARIKMAKGLGTWPAFWMLGVNLPEVGWPKSGEIDIIEGLGRDPLTAYTTIHGPGYSGGAGIGRHAALESSLADDFRVYAINWKEDYIGWEVDGEIFFEVTSDSVAPNEWVFNQPFYLIVNLAMGGNFPGNVAPDLKEATMLVDYIRYYSIDGVGELIRY